MRLGVGGGIVVASLLMLAVGMSVDRFTRSPATPAPDTVYVSADSTVCSEALVAYKRQTRALKTSLEWERARNDGRLGR